MEKILRKISVKDRLPENDGEYFVYSRTNGKGALQFNPAYDWTLEELEEIGVEYWYEEVDLDDIISIEKQKYLTELAEDFKEYAPNHFLAKEGYKKDSIYLPGLEE